MSADSHRLESQLTRLAESSLGVRRRAHDLVGRTLVGTAAAAAVAAAVLTLIAPAAADLGCRASRLAQAVDRVAFPYRDDRPRWRAVGARAKTLDGREIVTVFYVSRFGARVGYSIVAGSGLRVDGARVRQRGAFRYSLLKTQRLRLITWRRSAHTCLAGQAVSEKTLCDTREGQAGEQPNLRSQSHHRPFVRSRTSHLLLEPTGQPRVPESLGVD